MFNCFPVHVCYRSLASPPPDPPALLPKPGKLDVQCQSGIPDAFIASLEQALPRLFRKSGVVERGVEGLHLLMDK